MDADQHAQFLILVGDLCVGAGLAGLEVELETAHGDCVLGIPGVLGRPRWGADAEGIGYEREFRLDGAVVSLESIVGCRVRFPEQ